MILQKNFEGSSFIQTYAKQIQEKMTRVDCNSSLTSSFDTSPHPWPFSDLSPPSWTPKINTRTPLPASHDFVWILHSPSAVLYSASPWNAVFLVIYRPLYSSPWISNRFACSSRSVPLLLHCYSWIASKGCHLVSLLLSFYQSDKPVLCRISFRAEGSCHRVTATGSTFYRMSQKYRSSWKLWIQCSDRRIRNAKIASLYYQIRGKLLRQIYEEGKHLRSQCCSKDFPQPQLNRAHTICPCTSGTFITDAFTLLQIASPLPPSYFWISISLFNAESFFLGKYQKFSRQLRSASTEEEKSIKIDPIYPSTLVSRRWSFVCVRIQASRSRVPPSKDLSSRRCNRWNISAQLSTRITLAWTRPRSDVIKISRRCTWRFPFSPFIFSLSFGQRVEGVRRCNIAISAIGPRNTRRYCEHKGRKWGGAE